MGIFEQIDAGIAGLASQWNMYTTGLATLLVLVVSYRLFTATDPDVHPMLLARQSVASTVRNEGESAVYRSQLVPHGMPLRSGLNVKDPGVSKWAPGRDGDLRDVWRRAAQGSDTGAKGRILTVHGSENVVEHDVAGMTRQINLIGQHIAEQGGIRVAVYLPNSVELLMALFACSFYPNLTTVLLPYNVSDDELISMLRRSAVDTVIAASGSFPLDRVVAAYPSLRQLIWVVDDGSSHMDWSEVPEGTGGSVNVSTWKDVVQDAPASSGAELPPLDTDMTPADVVTFWQSRAGETGEMVRFTQANLAAGVGAQLYALPAKDRICASDLFLPADSLANSHTLVLTLAALYSNASVAVNSVAGLSPHLDLATQGVAPTVMVASPQTLLATHVESTGRLSSPLAKAAHSLSTRTLSLDGVFSPANMLSTFAAASRPAIGTPPGKLRLLYVADRAGADTPFLSSQVLSDLRIMTGARVVYALAAAKVAGAVSQTAFFDYRVDGEPGLGHFGAPLTSLEVFLKDTASRQTTDDKVEGEMYVRGPAVSGGQASVGAVGVIRDDQTLAYA